MRMRAVLEPAEPRSQTSLKEKPIKIGAKMVSHGRYVAFRMAEVMVSRGLFRQILVAIMALRPLPLDRF